MVLLLPRYAGRLLACLACAVAILGSASAAEVNSAATLRTRFTDIAARTPTSQFQRPVYLDSTESSNAVRGDIFALVDFPFSDVNAVFNGAARWCDVLILHINT